MHARQRRTLCWLWAVVAAGCGGAVATPATPADLAIIGTSVVDVAAGVVHPGRTVIVSGGRIVAVADSAEGFAPRTTIDGTGRFLMPGLWDNHVHFGGGAALIEENRNLLPLYVAHGITAVRDA